MPNESSIRTVLVVIVEEKEEEEKVSSDTTLRSDAHRAKHPSPRNSVVWGINHQFTVQLCTIEEGAAFDPA